MPLQYEPSIDVEKYIWDDKNQEWIDADNENSALDVPICTEITFMVDSLKFISADPEPYQFEHNPPFYNMFWLFPGPLITGETIEIYITAHVEGPECSTDYNFVEVFGTSEDGTIVTDTEYCYVHAIKKSIEFNNPFIVFLYSHPSLFPLIQKLFLKNLAYQK
jgi:hypothetical protein